MPSICRGTAHALVAACLTLSIITFPSLPALAAGSPDLAVAASGPGELLFGDVASHGIEACNPAGPAGFNLSFRAVLPPFTSPGANDATQVIADAPLTGFTTLIWDNVSDIPQNACISVSFDVVHDTTSTVFDVGDSYTVDVGAYTNTDPRFIPDFDPLTGEPISGLESFTGDGVDASSTDIIPIEITKVEPNTESELLRGVHDHQTTYTLTVQNNFVNPTDGVIIEDYLPAGMEFLSCGGDRTSDAPTNPNPPIGPPDEEYLGSGIINPNPPSALPQPPCILPSLVETVSVDPDGPGPLPLDVYTHVVWDNGGAGFDLLATESQEIQYLAAIPIRENTLTWTGATPPTTGQQAPNLDNNNGAETSEGNAAEQALTNYALAAGTYTRNDTTTVPGVDDTTSTVTSEDLSVHKSVSDETIAQGDVETWTLLIETSEYRAVDDIVVTDTIPDGLCPIGASNFDSSDPTGECDPIGTFPTISLNGGTARSIAYTSVSENPDGTWVVTFDPTVDSTLTELAAMVESSSVTITFPTRTREFYQENGGDDTPVLANDSWENTVAIEGTSLVPTIDTDQTVATQIQDESAAGQAAGLPSIDKTVSEPSLFVPQAVPPAATPCPDPSAIPGLYVDGPVADYGPGDVACWKLRVDFPAALDTGGSTVTDVMPPGHAYIPGSWAYTSNDSIGAATFTENGSSLVWLLGSAGSVDVGQTFEITFATEVSDPFASLAFDITANLMKFQSANTSGDVSPLRDQTDVEWAEAEVTLLKGVKRINGAPAGGDPSNTDGGVIVGTDTVEYRIDLTNTGDRVADEVEVWDVLPFQISCSDVSGISDGGTCNAAQNRLEWTGLTVPALGGTEELNYTVTIPAGISPNQQLDNTAGVRTYQSDTNSGGTFTYVPVGNIDPSLAASENTDAASDPSFVTTAVLDAIKDVTTAVTEPGNAAADQATIGERLDYSVTVPIPPLLTLNDPVFLDDLGALQTLDTASVVVTLDGADLSIDPNWSINTTGNAITVTYLGGAYTSDADGSPLVVTFSATVADVPGNLKGTEVANTADITWTDQSGSADLVASNETTVTVVEPNLQAAKTEGAGTTSVSGGDVVNFDLTLTNPSAVGSVSPAHDVTVVDTIPDFVSPVAPFGGGVWDSGARTITWTGLDLDPDVTTVLSYAAAIDVDVPAGTTLTNTVDATATSLAGGVAGERDDTSSIAGYAATDSYTLNSIDATIAKSVDPTSATIGEQVQYTIDVVVPANTVLWDARITDLVPDGVVFDGTASVSCTPACGLTAAELTATPNGDGTTTAGWWVGDILTSLTDRTITIVYDAHVADIRADLSSVGDGDMLDNTADFGWNQTNQVVVDPAAVADLTAPDEISTPATTTLDIVEPALTIVKQVDGASSVDAQPGESFTYTVVIENTGTSDAHDITVTDVPDVELTNVVAVLGAADVIDPWTAGDPDIQWLLPGPLAPGGQITLSYTADLVASSLLAAADTVDNTASASSFYGRPEAERLTNPTIDYRTYVGPNDSATINLYLPAATLDKLAVGPTPAEVGVPFEWSVTVSNTSTVASIGSVSMTDTLPPNWTYDAASSTYRGVATGDPFITADPTGDLLEWSGLVGIAPGASATLTFTATPSVEAQVDPGLGVDHTNTAQAAFTDATGASASADGPYETAIDTATTQLATGSLGDAIWFDADVNGLFDGVDIPLAGVAVDLVWAGPDGDLTTTGDNLTYTTVTAADGTYLFGDLPQGTFEVTVDAATLPPGTTASYDLDGSTVSPDGQWVGSLGSGQDNLDVDFGYTGTGSLGDFVWFDANGDGVQDPGEVGLPGVAVDLLWAGPDGDLTTTADNVAYTTTTAPDGSYLFPNLAAGTYETSVDASTLPPGLDETFDLDGIATPSVWEGTLGDGENKTDVDFGYNGDGSIGDLVWFDADTDGVVDVGEVGLPGVTVDLEWGGPDADLSTVGDNVAYSTTTGPDGTYLFDDLADGPYQVTVDSGTLPAGLTETYDLDGSLDSTATLDLNPTDGRDRTDVDFGYAGNGSLGDRLWFDANADRVQDPGEIGLAGVTVDLIWAGPDGDLATVADNVSYSATTAADGTYGFANLPAGQFEVSIDETTLPPGLIETFDLDGVDSPSMWTGALGDGEDKDDVDFGYTGTGSLGDLVWFDQDGDGTINGTEVGLGGVTVDLLWAGPDGDLATPADNVSYTTTTALDGTYLFPNLAAGTYETSVDTTTLPPGMGETFDLDGIATPSVWTGLLGDGEDKADVDFGYNGAGSLGDLVWFDSDADGIVDGTEVGLEGVAVEVIWAGPDGDLTTAGDNAFFATTSDPAGSWTVAGLPPGSYDVTVDGSSLPAGMAATYDLDDGIAAPDGNWSGSLADGDTKSDVDFGYNGAGSIGDLIWVDNNANGIVDGTEGAVIGATVELTWPGEDGVLGTGDEEVFSTTTDASGLYLFDGLPPGDYLVEVVGSLPATAPNTFDEDGNGDSQVVVALGDAEAHLTADFGYGGTSFIGDRIWWDLNGDGIQDLGEPGIGGIEVTLTGTNPDGSTFTQTTTTTGDGDYLFEGLISADYVVEVTDGLPPGIIQTYDDSGPLDNQSSVPGLPDNTAYLLADFGYLGDGSIGDRVWIDLSGDGIQDPGEAGLNGVDMILTWAGPDDVFGTADDVELRQTTAGDGSYLFASLPEGEYVVELDMSTVPPGLVVTSDLNGPVDGTADVTLAVGQDVIDADVGLSGPGSLGDYVWFDANADGTQDPGELPLEGVVVDLTIPGADGVIGGGDDVVVSATTDTNGFYLFTGLFDGEYLATVDSGTIPVGMAPTYDLDSGIFGPDGVWQGNLVTGDGAKLDVDFGYAGSGAIGDRLWLDLNGDGAQDPAEPGLPGVTVDLLWPGEDGVAGTADDEIISTVTGPDGVYVFPGLPGGDYTVSIPAPPLDLGATFDEDLLPDNTTDVVLADGENRTTTDFGLSGSAMIGDTVWYDVDADGVQDVGEPGIAGVEVTITWLGADGVVGGGDDVVMPAQVTDGDGLYSLSNLPEGSYVVVTTQGVPAGMAPTFDEDGLADGSATLPPIGSGEAHDTADFGLTGTASVSSIIWLDLDGDGVADAGEPGIPEVDVTLVWAGPDGILGTPDDVTFTSTTGTDGSYDFPNLPAGPVAVTVDIADLPPGVAPTFDPDGGFDDTATIVLSNGEASNAASFGYVGVGSLGDFVFYDFDSDGIAGPGEPGVEGTNLTVTLAGSDGILGTADDIMVDATTDAAGTYSVSGLPDGPFTVELDQGSLPEGVAPGSDSDAGDPATTSGILAGTAITDVDFGVVGGGSAGGGVFDDVDGNGIAGPGEAGIEGVTIVITWQGPDGPVTIEVVTGPDGAWTAPNLPPGDYTIEVDEATLPPDVAMTTPNPVDVTLGPDESLDVDFGATMLGEISGTLWVDSDGDRTLDPGEDLLEGVTVDLFDENGELVATVITGPAGTYSFPGLLPGTYTVTVDDSTLPDGIEPAPGSVLSVQLVVSGALTDVFANFLFQEVSGLPFTGLAWFLWTLVAAVLIVGGAILVGTRRTARQSAKPAS